MPACRPGGLGLRAWRCDRSSLRWPLPAKYTEAGGLTAYGYQGEVLLLCTAQLGPERAAADSLVLSARVFWLACRDLCVPGDTLLSLSLPVGARARPSAQAELFADYEARVPGPLPAAAGLRIRRPEPGRGAPVLLTLAGAASAAAGLPDFYPTEVRSRCRRRWCNSSRRSWLSRRRPKAILFPTPSTASSSTACLATRRCTPARWASDCRRAHSTWPARANPSRSDWQRAGAPPGRRQATCCWRCWAASCST